MWINFEGKIFLNMKYLKKLINVGTSLTYFGTDPTYLVHFSRYLSVPFISQLLIFTAMNGPYLFQL